MTHKPMTVGELRLPYDDEIIKIRNCSKCGKFVSMMNFEESGRYPHRDALLNYDDTPNVRISCSRECAFGKEESETE